MKDRDLFSKDRDLILTKLNELSDKIDSITPNQTVFVPSRAGLGYMESQSGSSSDEKDKLVSELQMRIETLDNALFTCQGTNKHLQDKVKVLECHTSQEKSWYDGQKAHSMPCTKSKPKARQKLQSLKTRKLVIQDEVSMVATKSSMFAHTVVETSIYGCLVERKPEMKLEMLHTMRERGDPMCQKHDPMLLLKRLR